LPQRPVGLAGTARPAAAGNVTPIDDTDLHPENFVNLATVMDDPKSFIIATATDRALLPPRLLDRFSIILSLNHLSPADLLLPPPAEDSAAVKARIARPRARPKTFSAQRSNCCGPALSKSR